MEAGAGRRGEGGKTRLMAETARSEAEKLIGYLLDDFYLELEPVGRLDIVLRCRDALSIFTRRCRWVTQRRNRPQPALALVRYGCRAAHGVKLDEAGRRVRGGRRHSPSCATMGTSRKQPPAGWARIDDQGERPPRQQRAVEAGVQPAGRIDERRPVAAHRLLRFRCGERMASP
jgi:hypothetical protein